MKNYAIVYFSQTGSTKKVAEAVASGLRMSGVNVDLFDISKDPPLDFSRYDRFGIGLPVFYYRPPFNVTAYLNKISGVNNKPAFILMLHGTYYGTTAAQVSKLLIRKGALSISVFHSFGTGYFLGYLKRGVRFSPQRPNQSDLESAFLFGRSLADGKVETIPEQRLGFIYRFEQFLTGRWFARNIYSRLFTVSHRCFGCGLCVRNCPTANLYRNKKNKPTRRRDCILCFSCEANCPQKAIKSPLGWPLFVFFLRYNICKGCADSTLEWEKDGKAAN